MISDRHFFQPIWKNRFSKISSILPWFQVCTYTKMKKIAKINFSQQFFFKLEIYVPNSPGIVLYAPGTNYSCLNRVLKIEQNPRFLVDFPLKIIGSFFHKQSLVKIKEILFLIKKPFSKKSFSYQQILSSHFSTIQRFSDPP